MEDKEENEIIPVNDDAPPVLMPPNQINNNNNNINNHNINNNNNLNYNINNNINNINIAESNFNLLSNNINNKNQIDENKQFQINNNNKNIRPQIPNMYMNNYYMNGFPPNVLRNQMYPGYGMMYANYFNQQQKKNINNVNNLYMPYIPNNNINNSINHINGNQIKDNSNANLHDLKLDIDSKVLNTMSKKYLLDIILFILDFCQIKIDSKFIHMKHDIFNIKKDKNKNNEHTFFIKKNKLNDLLYPKFENNINEIDENSSDSNSDDYNNGENNNINNAHDFSNNNLFHIPKYNNNNNLENFYCEVHEKVYMNTNKNYHYKSHLKCEKCGVEVRSKRLLKIHRNSHHHENIPKKVNENNNNVNINKSKNNELLKRDLNPNLNNINKVNKEKIENEEKIKCSDCDLFFNTVELMSKHFYENHEKNKIKNNINNKKDSFKNKGENIINKDGGENEKENEEEMKKKNHKKDEIKSEEFKKQQEIKKKEEKKRSVELKKLEEQKKKAQIQKEKEKEKELVQLQKNNLEERQSDIQNNQYLYKCYIDNKKFNTEKEYVMHFVHCHNGDFPFYCDICDKGFWSFESLEQHSKAKGHYD